jgi:hypothetical protein
MTRDDIAGSWAGAGVTNTFYKWSGSGTHAWSHYTAPFALTGMSNGTYTISWCSWDNVGNNETLHAQVVYIDTLAPTTVLSYSISYTSGTKKWVSNATSFTLTATDNAGGSGVAKTCYKWSGPGSHAWTQYTAPFQLTTMTNGTYTISWCSWDNLATPNNETLNWIVVYNDTITPTTTNSYAPAYTSGTKNWVLTSTPITLTANDNAGGSGVFRTYYKWTGTGRIRPSRTSRRAAWTTRRFATRCSAARTSICDACPSSVAGPTMRRR